MVVHSLPTINRIFCRELAGIKKALRIFYEALYVFAGDITAW
jgi:hypothetical protein